MAEGKKGDIHVIITGDESGLHEALKKGKEEIGELKDTFKELVVGGLALGGLGYTIEKVVETTVENEAALTQMTSALKANGGAAGETKADLLELAEANEKLSNYEKSNIEQAEAMLLRYNNIGKDVFPRALKSTLNLAAGMGLDLTSAAERVGSTLNNPLEALNRLRNAGISFTKQQEDQIKMMAAVGDVANAQNAILDALEHSYGGAAEAARDTFGGALINVKHAVGDLFDGSDGNLKDATGALNDLAKELRSPEVKEGFALITQAIITLVGWTAKATAGIASFAHEFGESIAQMAGYAGNIDDLRSRLEKLREARDATLRNSEETQRNHPFLASLFGQKGSADEEVKRLEGEIDVLERQIVAMHPDAPAEDKKEEAAPSERKPFGIYGQAALTPFQQAVAAAQAAHTILQAELAKMQTELDGQLQRNLISYKNYYAQKAALEQRGVDSEIRVRRAQIAELQAEAAQAKAGALTNGDTEKGAERAEQALDKVRVLEAEITALNIKRGQVAEEAANRQAEAEKRLAQQLQGVRAELLDAQGKTAEAATIKLHQQYDDLIKQLKAEGDTAGVELVENLFSIKTARAQLDEIEKQFSDALQNMQLQQQTIAVDQKAGLLSNRQAQQEILDLHKRISAQVAEMIPQMEKLAAATGDPQAIAHVKELELEFKKLSEDANEFGKAIEEGFASGIEQALDGLIKRTSTFADAWKKLWTSVNNAVDKAVEKKISDWLVGNGESALGQVLGGKQQGAQGQNASGSLLDTIGNKFAALFSSDNAKTIVTKVGDELSTLFQDGKDELSSIFSDLGNFFANIFGASGGGGGGDYSSLASAGAAAAAEVFHGGGIAGGPGAPRRSVPALTFAGAPRFHTGGEVPAILKAGEEVLTANDPRHVRNGGGRGDTHVHVNMNIQAKDATSFRHSQGQVMATAQAHAARAFQRNG